MSGKELIEELFKEKSAVIVQLKNCDVLIDLSNEDQTKQYRALQEEKRAGKLSLDEYENSVLKIGKVL